MFVCGHTEVNTKNDLVIEISWVFSPKEKRLCMCVYRQACV